MIKKYKATEDKLYDLINKDFKDKGGVYTLQCCYFRDSDNLRAVNRILGTDNSGVLYIGKTDRFVSLYQSRIIDLKKSVLPKYKSLSHVIGQYYKINEQFENLYPIELLRLKVEDNDNPKEYEKELLEKYTLEFGELPPFNSRAEFMTDLIIKLINRQ